MAIDYHLLGQCDAELMKADSLQEQFKIYEKYVYRLGFDGAVYSLIPKMILEHDMGVSPIFLVSEGFPLQFLESYQGLELEKNDFTIRRIQEKKLDMMDWGFYKKHELITPEEQKVISIAQSHHINNAISIPTLNNGKAIAGASIISRDRGKLFEELKKSNLATLNACTRSFHSNVCNNEKPFHPFLPQSLIKFTKKEKTVFRYKIAGKTMKDLGKSKEGISRRYGEKLSIEVRERYGNMPMNQLLYYMGQLDIL